MPNSKTTLRAQLNQLWFTVGIKPEELEDPFVPEAGEFLYSVFWDLWSADTGIEYSEIYNYQKLFNIEFSGEDITILRTLSRFASNWVAERGKPKETNPTPQKNNGQRR